MNANGVFEKPNQVCNKLSFEIFFDRLLLSKLVLLINIVYIYIYIYI